MSYIYSFAPKETPKSKFAKLHLSWMRQNKTKEEIKKLEEEYTKNREKEIKQKELLRKEKQLIIESMYPETYSKSFKVINPSEIGGQLVLSICPCGGQDTAGFLESFNATFVESRLYHISYKFDNIDVNGIKNNLKKLGCEQYVIDGVISLFHVNLKTLEQKHLRFVYELYEIIDTKSKISVFYDTLFEERMGLDSEWTEFILNYLNHFDILEHGGSIGGSWMYDEREFNIQMNEIRIQLKSKEIMNECIAQIHFHPDLERTKTEQLDMIDQYLESTKSNCFESTKSQKLKQKI